MGAMTIKVFLLDDHEIVRRGLRDLLEAEDDFTVVGEATTADQALNRIPATQPDVAVLDVRLGGEAGATLGLLEPRPGLVLHPGQFGGPGAAVPDRTFRGRAPVPRRAERRALIPLRQEWGP